MKRLISRTPLTIAALNFKRLFKDRLSLFFVFLFPAILTLVIGVAIFDAGGSGAVRVGVSGSGTGALGAELIGRISETVGLKVERFASDDELRKAVRRQTILAGVIIPSGYDDRLRRGEADQVDFLTFRPQGAPTVRAAVEAIVADQGSEVKAALFAQDLAGGDLQDHLAKAELASQSSARIEVASQQVGSNTSALPTGFGYPAAANLILFVFITTLVDSQRIIENRRQGISRRILAAPATAGTLLAGEALSRFSIAVFQGLFIFAMATAFFDVKWGNSLGAVVVILVFALAATGASMLLGTVFRTAEQAASIGPPLGIALGMLGGCMWPLEIVGSTMRAVGHITPHAWAMDAFIGLIARGQTLVEIWPKAAVIAGIAALLLLVSTNRLQKAIIG